MKDKVIWAFVDGSSDFNKQKIGGGIVLYNPNTKETFKYRLQCPDGYASLNNVAGELFATMKAIKLAINYQYKKIIIFYDFEGIEKWINGKWKAKKPFTKDYKDFVEACSNYIDISFSKVKAHKKKKERTFENDMNEIADKLAKEAVAMSQKQ